MHVAIGSKEELEQYLKETGALTGAVVQGLDLRDSALVRHRVQGAVFLGCNIDPDTQARLARAGALVFPAFPNLPYQPYRSELYTPMELMQGYDRDLPESIEESLDFRIYRHYVDGKQHGTPSIAGALAQRLHDHAIDTALAELIRPPAKLVAIMGGHAMRRDESAYRDVAIIARGLARRGYMLVSGGGPGAMEATHLGAWLANEDDAALEQALAYLEEAPSYSDPGWHRSAYHVRDHWKRPATSLGIPTWFYGHEPPNLFATHIAKYFSNSLREDGLLAIAKHGVVYSPGSAGTIQEVFMDAAQNHYGTFTEVSPMVLFGREYWTVEKPVYPLLERLSKGRQYASMISLLDDPLAVVDYIASHPPVRYEGG